MRKYYVLATVMIVSSSVFAQEKVHYDYLGLSFEIPAGWSGEEGDGFYALQNQDGYVVLLPHEATNRAELDTGAQEGLQFSDDTMFQLNGEVSNFGDSGIEADMIGIVEWAPMEAHAVALLSPHGKGVVVMSLVGLKQLREKHRDLARTVANTVQFFEAVIPPVVEEWKVRFDGKKVAYANTSGGTSDSSSWTLCGERFWYYGSTSSYSDTEFNDGSVVSSTALGNGRSEGTWTIEADGKGGAVFVVQHDNGRVGRFSLKREDGKTYMSGSRYFVVAGDC